MKGLCIDATETRSGKLKEGNWYELEPPLVEYNEPAYWLPELGDHYNANRFVTDSDLDETVIHEQVVETIKTI